MGKPTETEKARLNPNKLLKPEAGALVKVNQGEGQYGAIAKRLDKVLTERQNQYCREIALELVAKILQQEAPEPTRLEEYSDLFELTQVEGLVKFQEDLYAMPIEPIHPAERVMAMLVQLQMTEAVLQGVLGYLWKLRRTVALTDEHLRGVMYQLLKSEEDTVVEMEDPYGRVWHCYPNALTPDGVVVRRKPRTRGKDKKKRKPRARR